jgi:hypothetical protein
MLTPVLLLALQATPIQVMVVGTYHFGNPGRDVHNVKADSVLTPERQAELDGISAALAEFKPTKIMVEVESDAPDLAVERYRKFSLDSLKSNPNETEQIGFRLAKRMGHSTVYGIDEQPKQGEPDYFPYRALEAAAAANRQTAALTESNAPVGKWTEDFSARQKSSTLASLLAEVNRDDHLGGMALYYAMLPIGDNHTQAGADLNAMWYLRNAKIFAKLMHAARPGDRVLVVYGSGHNYWLRHFARETPGYQSIDPIPYLQRAAP